MRTGLLIMAACLLAACANPTTGEPHPANALDYPVAITADPSGRYVWVSSGNFDLSYRGGAVLAVDVATNRFVGDREATDAALPGVAQVGGFPGPVHLLQREGEAVSAYVLSRADDSLYHLTITDDDGAPRLSCAGESVQENGVIACPSSGAFQGGLYPQDGEPVEATLGSDPFGAIIHHARDGEDQDLLLTGGMLDGALTMFGLGSDGAPRLLDQLTINTGLFAFVESPSTGHIITAHKSLNVFSVLQVVPTPADEADPTLYDTPTLQVLKTLVIPASAVQDHVRGMAVSADGSRLYAAYRSPSSLLVVDISAGAEVSADERLLAKIPVGGSPGSVVAVPADDTHPAELVYVSAYSGDRVDVVDPNLGLVVDSIATGHGPFGMAHVQNRELGIDRLYVGLFHDQSVAVIELDSASPYHHTVIAEIR